jgi:hypothetical protein
MAAHIASEPFELLVLIGFRSDIRMQREARVLGNPFSRLFLSARSRLECEHLLPRA